MALQSGVGPELVEKIISVANFLQSLLWPDPLRSGGLLLSQNHGLLAVSLI